MRRILPNSTVSSILRGGILFEKHVSKEIKLERNIKITRHGLGGRQSLNTTRQGSLTIVHLFLILFFQLRRKTPLARMKLKEP